MREASQQPPLRVDNALVRTLKRVLRRGRGEPREPGAIVCGETKYGCDPRGPEDFVDGSDYTVPVVAADFADVTFPAPGEVGELVGGVAHLNALLNHAGERALVLKFRREGCAACKSTVESLASAARAYSDRACFVNVDYSVNRQFCKQCALAVVPCAHVYVSGQLTMSEPLGPRAWGKFATRLEALLGEPASEVLPADIPEDKSVDVRSVAGLDTYL